MSTTLEQRQAVGTEAAPKVVRKSDRGPIWPFIVGGLALMAVVVAGITFSIGEQTVPFESDQAVIEGSSAAVREQGPYAVAPQVEVRTGDLMTESREGGAYGIVAPTGTLQGLGIDQRVGQAYLEAQEHFGATVGTRPPPTTDWWNQTEAREGGTYVTGTLQGLGIDQAVGQAYLDAQDQAGGAGGLTVDDLHTEAREG